MHTTELILPGELAELDATAAAIPGTTLVHLQVADARGLVLTRPQAQRLMRELRTAVGNASWRGGPAAGAAVRGARPW